MLGRKVSYVRYINCSHNSVAKGICLLDKKAFFAYTGKFHASQSFVSSTSIRCIFEQDRFLYKLRLV